MKYKNVKTLENLSLFCHFSGIITVFLGIVVILMDLSNKDFAHIQIGFFVLVVGYAFVKISAKVSRVVCDEEKRGL
ncbi:MAG: hypothetical protein KAR31_10920 [Candidatus Omnitrophica bacterium]|nr:hypothetical protein [Candidatus Omnitrophota bacterium]